MFSGASRLHQKFKQSFLRKKLYFEAIKQPINIIIDEYIWKNKLNLMKNIIFATTREINIVS